MKSRQNFVNDLVKFSWIESAMQIWNILKYMDYSSKQKTTWDINIQKHTLVWRIV